MHSALRVGLVSGDPGKAKEHFLHLAAQPGLASTAYNLFDIAMHHATLMETVAAYLLTDGAWTAAEPLPHNGHLYHPQSFLMKDGRLRRVILCDRWDALRQETERHSWRTVFDVSLTNRPMLLNVVVIGQSRRGFRPSPWTQAFIHPENHMMRVKRKEGSFNSSWGKVYRENTSRKPLEWLKLMQDDNAFDDLIFTMTVDTFRRDEALEDIDRINKEIKAKSITMNRSSCFHFSPCEFVKLCYGPEFTTPELSRWPIKK